MNGHETSEYQLLKQWRNKWMTDWDRFHIVSAQQLRRTSNILDKVVRKRKKNTYILEQING